MLCDNCWRRDLLVVQKISYVEIISTTVLLATVVVDLSRVFQLLTQLHFNLLTGAHLLLMEH